MDDYLSKPFRPEQLIECIARWLPELPAEAPAEPAAAPAADADADADAADDEPAAVAAEPGPRAPIDRESLDRLRDLDTEDSGKLLERIVHRYLDSSPDLLATLRKELERGNAVAVKEAAHSLKSASDFLGALEVAELCQSLEDHALQNAMDQAMETLAVLEPAFEVAKAALEGEISSGLGN